MDYIQGLINNIFEIYKGGDLNKRIIDAKNSQEWIDEKSIIHWILQVVDALSFAHKNKIIHRDIKPQNIFIDNKGLVKLGDFGVVKDLSKVTSANFTAVGTPSYFAPEQMHSLRYDHTVDIWALGNLFFRLFNKDLSFALYLSSFSK